MLDSIAAWLAAGFHRSDLTYEFCDWVVNRLVWYHYEGAEWAELFWRTYLAFDAGEHIRTDRPLEDPVEVYTRPAVRLLVKEYGLADEA